MAKHSRLFLLCILPLLGWGEADVNTTFFRNLAVKGYDPVAYFTEGKPVEGKKEFSTEWKGAVWRFASKENLQAFKEDPEKYAPQYGGYCAWAVSQGDKADIDPKQWTIEGGKLYLNYDAGVQRKWLKDKTGFISRADRIWPELQKK